MLPKFALAANALPTDQDALAKVRLFLGKPSPVKSVLTLGSFEGFSQEFRSYLVSLAAERVSEEREYTDVHGVCGIEHSERVFKVLGAEVALTPPQPDVDLFERATLLRTLIKRIVRPQTESVAVWIGGRGHTRAEAGQELSQWRTRK
jgi:hypothetical protein